jgi:hypothetical protein
LVAFLVALTDPRVQFERAPFDHPELRVPSDGFDGLGKHVIEAVGASGNARPLETFLELNPQDAIFTPRGLCNKNAR